MRILIVGPSWVGDMVMAQTLFQCLRQRHPECVIDVLAPEWSRPILERMPEVRQALSFPLGHGVMDVATRRRIGRGLRGQYEQAILLPNSLKSALVPWFAGIPKRTGWRGEMRYGLLNDVRVLDKEAWPLMVERYVALAYDKGIMRTAQDLPQPLLWPQLQVSEGEKSYTCNQFSLSSERPMIGFCPGAEFGPAKRWPHYHYAELAKQLIDEGYQVVLFGSAKDHEAGNEILAALNTEQQAWCRNLAGETQLDQAVILIAACKAIVTNDSGLMHVAAALNRPLVALYGPSSPDFTPPLSHKARVIRLITGYHKVRKGDAAEGYHQSLIDITPQRVLEELNALLLQEEA